MTDLYSSLFKWAHRQDENFLTDAFAFLLARLLEKEPHIGRELALWLCFGDTKPAGFAGPLKVTTQVTVSEGRPDIWLRGDDSLALLEVKKDSGLGERQLARYREILTKSNRPHTRLVLLTQYTVDCAESDEPDHRVRWADVADRLQRLPTACPATKFLITEFTNFLRSQQMTNERVGSEFIAGAHAQRNMLVMLRRALELAGIKNRKRSGGWDWIGYYLDDKNFWVGFEYGWPDSISFCFEGAKADGDQLKSRGWTMEFYNNWYCFLDLRDESSGFFQASAEEQLAKLKKFVAAAYGQAQQAKVTPKRAK